jgi:hypothetical protein
MVPSRRKNHKKSWCGRASAGKGHDNWASAPAEHRIDHHALEHVSGAGRRDVNRVRQDAGDEARAQARDARPRHAPHERDDREADAEHEVEAEQHRETEQQSRGQRPSARAAIVAIGARLETGREAAYGETDTTDPRQRGQAERDDDESRRHRGGDGQHPAPAASEGVDAEHDRELLHQAEAALAEQ